MTEVLQIEQVFTNVSKGQVAKTQDLEKAFGTSEVSKCVAEARLAVSRLTAR